MGPHHGDASLPHLQVHLQGLRSYRTHEICVNAGDDACGHRWIERCPATAPQLRRDTARSHLRRARLRGGEARPRRERIAERLRPRAGRAHRCTRAGRDPVAERGADHEGQPRSGPTCGAGSHGRGLAFQPSSAYPTDLRLRIRGIWGCTAHLPARTRRAWCIGRHISLSSLRMGSLWVSRR